MINLIDRETRRALRLSYYIRLAAAAVTLLGVVFLIGAVSLLPTYIFSLSKNREATLAKENLDAILAAEEKEAPSSEIAALKEKLGVLSGSQSTGKLFSAVEAALGVRPSGVRVNDISYTKRDQGGELVVVGIASTRDALLSYHKELKKEALFSSVILPVSDLAKDSDVDFILTLTGLF